MVKKNKYALYKYSSHNIGDEIQSLAAQQFLPKTDYYIDRDRLGEWKNSNSNETVKLIANGWYMSNPMSWPAQDSSLDTLLTSIHINESDPEAVTVFSSETSVSYLKRHSYVGARDESTQKLFKELGIDATMSACVTLTLQRDENIKKQDFVLCVTVSDEVYEAIKQNTNRVVIRIDTTTFKDGLKTEEKMKLAEQFLYLYQSAHYVVTTRLHAALPSLALEVPVTYIVDSGAANYDPSRLNGLKELTNYISEEDFLSSLSSTDLDTPKSNPTGYIKYRDKLTTLCEEFTGHAKSKSFARLNNFSEFSIEQSELMYTIIYNYDHLASQHLSKLKEEEKINSELESELDSIKKSAKKLFSNIARRISNR